jgi:S-DNA-T family DNA segregation ATPase FtsK/SpoIIIE
MFKIILLVAAVLIFRHFHGRTRTLTAPTGQVCDLFEDMLSQPHLLIAGATGSGKSVAINGLLNTLLYRLPFDQSRTDGPDGVQFILIDPKRVELAAYAKLPHTLAHAAGFNPSAWLEALNRAVRIMDDRYSYMERKHMKIYDRGDLYVVIDEWANVYKNGGKDAYKAVLRLISEGRAARVHLLMATQVPKAEIIPTEIRENFSARLCLFTNNAAQSRVIMDENGCENLPDPKTAGYAQGFYVLPGKGNNTLCTIPYVRDDEINRNIAWWMNQVKRSA